MTGIESLTDCACAPNRWFGREPQRRRGSAKPFLPKKTARMLHELSVHQIELEMQNEELRRAQVELDAAQERYFDLYELAPVAIAP